MNLSIFPFVVKIGGQAGNGIMASGLTFSKVATRSGYQVYNYTEYPSLIRGGHNIFSITISDQNLSSQYSHTNCLVALNQETVDLHLSTLSDNSFLIYDSNCDIKIPNTKAKVIPVPLTTLVKDVNGSLVMRNSAALAVAVSLLGADFEILRQILDSELGNKNQLILDMNHRVLDHAKKYLVDNFSKEITNILPNKFPSKKPLVATGNEVAALASLKAGMTFFSVYPMTPTSGIMHYLTPLQKDYNFVYRQPEDEIAAINMAIGASTAGARAMVATSGGGFCLMSEGLGLSAMTETPLVIIEGMRGSPATGLPTWTEQGDLRFVLHAHQGDFPKIVLAPGDHTEIFEYVLGAFNLADIYQCPVVVLLDKYLCESHVSLSDISTEYSLNRGEIINESKTDYARFKNAPSGISPRALAGSGNFFIANSDEHDEFGFSIENSQTRNIQMQKRLKKMATCKTNHMTPPVLYGPPNAPVTIVSWGSNKGAILEALKKIDFANFLHLTWLHPFPDISVAKYLKSAKHILNIECNFSAQLAGLIREKTGINITDNLLKYDGRPFYPEEIIAKLKTLKFHD